MRAILALFKQAFVQWRKDNAHRIGAALAYYALFSIAPLLLLAVAIAGLMFGRQAAEGQIVAQIENVVGYDGARSIETMINSARKPAAGITATIVGIALLLLGASGVFNELQAALNRIWGVTVPQRGLLGIIKERFLSFAMVLGIGFLLLVSLVVSAAVAAAGSFLALRFPGSKYLLQMSNFVLGFGVSTALIAMIYKILPETRIHWRDVWMGATVASILLTIGKSLIGLYLAKTGVASAYGAAGSLVVILIWVYWSAQILLYGAEFAEVYCRWHGTTAGKTGRSSWLRPHDASHKTRS
ncbi:MAG TPA: YihY/virulence factor BrkB family protein [Acidobacteriota bacterium]